MLEIRLEPYWGLGVSQVDATPHGFQGIEVWGQAPGMADLDVTTVGVEEQVGVADEQRRSRGVRDS